MTPITQILADLEARQFTRRDIAEETGLSQGTLSGLAHGKSRVGSRSLDGVAALGAFWAVASVKDAVNDENAVVALKSTLADFEAKTIPTLETPFEPRPEASVALTTDEADRWVASPEGKRWMEEQALYAYIRADEQNRPLAEIHPNQQTDYQGTPCTAKRLRNIVIAGLAVAVFTGLAFAVVAKADLTAAVMQAAK